MRVTVAGLAVVIGCGVTLAGEAGQARPAANPLYQTQLLVERAVERQTESLTESLTMLSDASRVTHDPSALSEAERAILGALQARIQTLRTQFQARAERLQHAILRARDLASQRKVTSAQAILKNVSEPVPTHDTAIPFRETQNELDGRAADAEARLNDANKAAALGLEVEAVAGYESAETRNEELADFGALKRTARTRAKNLREESRRVEALVQQRHIATARRAFELARPLLPADENVYKFGVLDREIADLERQTAALLEQGSSALASRHGADALKAFQEVQRLDADRELDSQIDAARDVIRGSRPFESNDAPRRLYLSVNENLFLYATPLTDGFSFVAYNQLGHVGTSFPSKRPHLGRFDAVAWARVWGAMAVGVGYSEHIAAADASMSADVPYPTFVGSRAVSQSIGRLERSEKTWHAEVGGVFGNEQGEFAIFVGPSQIAARQPVLSSISIRELAGGRVLVTPNLFTSAATSSIGVNVLIDGSYMFSRYVGIGGYFRFTAANGEFTDDSGRSIPATIGGSNVGWGLRVRS